MKVRIRELIEQSREPKPRPTEGPLVAHEGWPITIQDAARMLNIGYATAYWMFRHEPGAIVVGGGKKNCSVRIPKEVFDRKIAERRV